MPPLIHSPYLNFVCCLDNGFRSYLYSLHPALCPELPITFSYHVVLVFFNLECFLSLSLSFWTSIFFKSPGQLFCRIRWFPVILSLFISCHSTIKSFPSPPSITVWTHTFLFYSLGYNTFWYSDYASFAERECLQASSYVPWACPIILGAFSYFLVQQDIYFLPKPKCLPYWDVLYWNHS